MIRGSDRGIQAGILGRSKTHVKDRAVDADARPPPSRGDTDGAPFVRAPGPRRPETGRLPEDRHLLDALRFDRPRLQPRPRPAARADAPRHRPLPRAYYFSGTDRFEECLDLLVRLVFAPHFTDEGVAKEKLIIEQELKMYDDQPDYRIYKNLMAALYRDHPVRIDIGGSVETIQEIDTPLLTSCYRRFYHPANMGFMASGDLDADAIFARLEKALPPSSFGASKDEIARDYPSEPPAPTKELVRDSAVVSRPRVIVGYKDLALEGSLLDRELATSVLLDNLFGSTSAFHAKWFRRGLIDDTFSASHTAEPEFGFTLIGGETDEPEKLAAEIRKEIARAGRARFKKRDLDRARRKRLGRYLRSFDSPDGIAFMVLGFAMKGLDVFSFPKALSRLTPARIHDRLREHLREDRAAVSILDPKRNGQ
jgi:predicted Zn-dependent peptidase